MIVDSTFLVDLVRGDPGARAAAEAAEESSDALRLPAPALARFWEAVQRSRRPPRDIATLQAVLLGLPSVAFTADHALVAARLLAQGAAAGAALDPFDAMVAAVALVEEEPLLTRDARRYERVPDLLVRTY